MNKKDIAAMRKEFKDDSFKLRIKDLCVFYIQKEKIEVFHKEHFTFSLLEPDQQELYLKNFKKVINGNLDEKLFLVDFDPAKTGSTGAQSTLERSIDCSKEDFLENMAQFVSRAVSEENKYKEDMIFSFLRAEYMHVLSKKNEHGEEGNIKQTFVFGSLNKTSKPKNALLFDYTNKEFKSNLVLDAIINLTTPTQGFMYPTLHGTSINMQQFLYSTSKKNVLDPHFIQTVLHGISDKIETADDEIANFNEVLHKILNGKTTPQILSDVYYRIDKIVENNKEEGVELVKIDHMDISDILFSSGVDVALEDVKQALKEVVDNEKHEFRAVNLLTQKKMQINTPKLKLTVDAIDLQKVRQVRQPNGKLTLIIDVDEEVGVHGLTFESEEIKK